MAPRRPGADRLGGKRLSGAGFSVVRNSPYAGGYTTALYGRGAAGCHALQIEINRSLYLDEESIARRPASMPAKAAERGSGQADSDPADRAAPPWSSAQRRNNFQLIRRFWAERFCGLSRSAGAKWA